MQHKYKYTNRSRNKANYSNDLFVKPLSEFRSACSAYHQFCLGFGIVVQLVPAFGHQICVIVHFFEL